jgi:hypothetical protein
MSNESTAPVNDQLHDLHTIARPTHDDLTRRGDQLVEAATRSPLPRRADDRPNGVSAVSPHQAAIVRKFFANRFISHNFSPLDKCQF